MDDRPLTGAPREFRRVRGATPEEIGITLADMARQVPADQAIVEIGVFQGRTALLMAYGARKGNGAHVWGFDPWDLAGNTYGRPFNRSASWAAYNVRATGYARAVTLTKTFSKDAAAAWDGPLVGLLFVDGDHTYEGARDDITAWAPHLAPGAVIAVDDYGHPDWPGVAEAVDALVAEGFLAPIELFHDRLAVTQLAAEGVDSAGAGRVVAMTGEGMAKVAEATGVPVELLGEPAAQPDRTVETVAAGFYSPEHEAVAGRQIVTAEEARVLEATAGTITDLTLPQLKGLAKLRGIKLGIRKDKKADTLQALRDGR